MPVVKIHGINGSGKSTLIRALMERFKFEVIETTDSGRPLVYAHKMGPKRKLIVLGSYVNACGGLDTISEQATKMRLLETYATKYNTVFMEGILPSTTYGAFGEFSERPGQNWLYVFLDTPFEVCVERVLARRKAKGNDKPFDPERSMRPKIKAVAAVRARVEAERKHEVHVLSHKYKPAVQVDKLLAALRGD